MAQSKWWSIGGSLFLGLFVAYLDRTNLSVAISSVAEDLGFAGDQVRRNIELGAHDIPDRIRLLQHIGRDRHPAHGPKVVVTACFALWSVATVVVGFTSSVAVLLICRLILGVAEGIYWPQQSRFARAWFAPHELTGPTHHSVLRAVRCTGYGLHDADADLRRLRLARAVLPHRRHRL